MELTGKIISIMEAMSGPTAHNGHCYMSQDYVLEVSGIFPRHCKFRIFGEDRIKQFNIQVGEELTVLFNIEAKERIMGTVLLIHFTRVIRRHDVCINKQ